MTAGNRRDLITIERGTATQDESGEEVLAWATLGQEFALVIYGTGAERRQAAMEGGELPATFYVDDNSTTRNAKLKDRISFDGGAWDITDNKPSKQLGEREITATRSL